MSETKWVHYLAAMKVARILNQHKFEAYLIGGAVRDVLLGHLPKDFDLVTNAKPEEILKLPELGASKYKDTAQAFGVTRVRVDVKVEGAQQESEVEVATYRRDIEAHLGRKATKVEFAHLEDDVLRRDFTVNALALDLTNDYLVDLVDGMADLDGKLMRFIGDPAERIKEDPLRVLRGIRLKNQLGFIFEAGTAQAIHAAVESGVISQIATERLSSELTRMLTHSSRRESLLDLEKFRILEKMLPELAATKGVLQPPEFHGEGDVWEHTLLAMSYLPAHPSPRLAWATLLHDIGKAPTARQAEDRIRFDRHYEVGAQLAKELMGRLRFSNTAIDEIYWMINHHMGIDDLPKMKGSKAQAFLSHPAFTDLLELHKADAHATWHMKAPGKLDTTEPEFPELEKIWEQFKAQKQRKLPSLKNDIGVDGNWLKAEFNLDGARLGKVLDRLNEAYLDGEIKSKAEAKALAKSLL